MIVGFDYWQVLSHFPDEVTALARALEAAGHEVHVVSAIGRGRIGTVAGKVARHWPGFPAEQVHEVVFERSVQAPELKLAKCRELGIAMFFDDRDDVCRALGAAGIVAMRVTRRDGGVDDLAADQDR